MLNDVSQRESLVLDFINTQNKEKQDRESNEAIQNSPEVKMRKLQSEANKATSICIDTLLGKVYKNALPFDDPKRDYSDEEMAKEIGTFISDRTGGKTSEYYVREAIRKNNSSLLKNIIAEATSISRSFFNEKAKNIGVINIADLNYKIDADKNKIDNISRKLELDEIADVIRDNVQKSIKDESEKAKREEEYNKMIEDKLAEDMEVVDDTSMESVMMKMNPIRQTKIYQPSLLEAIMIGKAGVMKESATEDIFLEAVEEFTKLNIVKAMRLESFKLNDIRKLANSYTM